MEHGWKRRWLCRGSAGVNQWGDLVPAAFYLSLCACEGFGVAAGLWSRPEHNPLPRGQAWSDWSTDWLLSLFPSFTPPSLLLFPLDFALCHTAPICSHFFAAAILCPTLLYSSSFYIKRGLTVMSQVFLLPWLAFWRSVRDILCTHNACDFHQL